MSGETRLKGRHQALFKTTVERQSWKSLRSLSDIFACSQQESVRGSVERGKGRERERAVNEGKHSAV